MERSRSARLAIIDEYLGTSLVIAAGTGRLCSESAVSCQEVEYRERSNRDGRNISDYQEKSNKGSNSAGCME